MTLKEARERMKTRKDRYVVGYIQANNTVYGKGINSTGDWSYTDPVTLPQAQVKLAEMPCAKAAIFELRPIAINR